MRSAILIVLLLLLFSGRARAQTTIFNCLSGWSTTTSAACGIGILGPSGTFQEVGTQNGASPSISGTQLIIIPTGGTHVALSLMYQTLVNVQAFNTTFTFVPNGQNVVFMLNNSNNNPSFNNNAFSAGAGCEANFYQGFAQANPPNNVFALELDSYSPATVGGSFTYSTAQVYQSNPYVQSGCSPAINGETIYNKVSTSPVPLNSPAGSQNTANGDTFSANIVYNGTSVVLNLYDVTASGSCPGASCFSHTFTTDAAGNAINVTSSVGSSNTAWAGLGAATGIASSYPLYINGWSYTVTTGGGGSGPATGPGHLGRGGMW